MGLTRRVNGMLVVGTQGNRKQVDAYSPVSSREQVLHV